MHGDLLDLALIVIAVAFGVSGYRQGFIIGALSFVGFVGGAVLGAQFGPGISQAVVGGQNQQDVVAVVILVAFAIIGQFLASSIGAAMRRHITSRSSTRVDSVGGSAVSVLSMLVTAWAIGSLLISSPFPVVDQQVNDSAVLHTLDSVMPSPAKTMFSDFRRMIASGPFPQVFSGIGDLPLLTNPSPPSSAVLNSPGYQAARTRVLKVQGTAPSCSREIEGSGFVYAPDHIMTNAHVVAGVTQGPTVTTQSGTVYNARVVFYDPQVDIAVLYVPGLDMAPLSFAGPANSGDSAVVAGYPLNHSFTQVPARIAGTQEANGPDIYQTGTVNRQIYGIRAVVQPGNSGGPLFASDGKVDGVVFAAAVGEADTGFALTAKEVAADASSGRHATTPVSTQGCD